MTLGDRIADFLAGTGRPLTAEEIARGVHQRTIEVRMVLQSDARFVPWPHERKRLYGVTGDREGAPSPQDGRPVRSMTAVILPNGTQYPIRGLIHWKVLDRIFSELLSEPKGQESTATGETTGAETSETHRSSAHRPFGSLSSIDDLPRSPGGPTSPFGDRPGTPLRLALGPGERVVNGEVLYSSQWLSPASAQGSKGAA